MQNELIGKDSIIKDLKDKVNELEEMFDNLKDDLRNKTATISGLELRLDELEKKQNKTWSSVSNSSFK